MFRSICVPADAILSAVSVSAARMNAVRADTHHAIRHLWVDRMLVRACMFFQLNPLVNQPGSSIAGHWQIGPYTSFAETNG